MTAPTGNAALRAALEDALSYLKGEVSGAAQRNGIIAEAELALAAAIPPEQDGYAEGRAREATRDELDAWLNKHCGSGLPYGEAIDEAGMLHGLAYVLRAIESTSSYKVNIGQCNSATSALRLALDHFARGGLATPTDRHAEGRIAGLKEAGWAIVPVEITQAMLDATCATDDDDKAMRAAWSELLRTAPKPPASIRTIANGGTAA